MKTDAQIRESICEELTWNITLRGTVRAYAGRKEAERAAWSAPRVKQVQDLIAIGV